jgi:hypothetical protein
METRFQDFEIAGYEYEFSYRNRYYQIILLDRFGYWNTFRNKSMWQVFIDEEKFILDKKKT